MIDATKEQAATDNPSINCTEYQLAWCTWQIARGKYRMCLGKVDPMLDDTAEERARFDAWWEKALTQQWASLRVLMEVTWDVAQQPMTFDVWWTSIVDGANR